MSDKWRPSHQASSVLLQVRRTLLRSGEDSAVKRIYRVVRRIPGVRQTWRFLNLRTNEAVSEPVLAFWRDHGREWASHEALPQDLAIVGKLAERIRQLGAREKKTEIVAALQKVWAGGFSDPEDAFPWDGMNDRLPPAALVAFVEGAASVFAERQPQP